MAHKLKRKKVFRYYEGRQDWRDPNMRCVRVGTVNGVFGTHLIKPDDLTNYYKWKMANGYGQYDWSNDPSYHWKNNLKKLKKPIDS